jgi:hypothetical protein
MVIFHSYISLPEGMVPNNSTQVSFVVTLSWQPAGRSEKGSMTSKPSLVLSGLRVIFTGNLLVLKCYLHGISIAFTRYLHISFPYTTSHVLHVITSHHMYYYIPCITCTTSHVITSHHMPIKFVVN